MAEEKQTTLERRLANLAEAEEKTRAKAERKGLSDEQIKEYIQNETQRERDLVDRAKRIEDSRKKVADRKSKREEEAKASAKKTPSDQVTEVPGNAAGKVDIQDADIRNRRDRQVAEAPQAEPAPLPNVPNTIALALKSPIPPLDLPPLPFPKSTIPGVSFNDFMPRIRSEAPTIPPRKDDAFSSRPSRNHPFRIVQSSEVQTDPATEVVTNTIHKFFVSSYGSTITDGTSGDSVVIAGLDQPINLGTDNYVVLQAQIDQNLIPSSWELVYTTDVDACKEVEIDPSSLRQTLVRLYIGKIIFQSPSSGTGPDVPFIMQAIAEAQLLTHGLFNGICVRCFQPHPVHPSHF